MLIIGHRGARGLAPENTIASFKVALDCAVDAIECDVRVTKDDVVVMAHGSKTRGDEGRLFKVIKYTYGELKARYSDLVTLEEAVRYVNRKVPLYLEIKPWTKSAPVVLVISKLLKEGWQPDDFRFVSFDYRLLKRLHAALPEVGIIVNGLVSGVWVCYRAQRLDTRRIDMYCPYVWSGFVRAVSRRGYELYVFPQNNVDQSRRWEKLGLAGVITDYPDRFTGKTPR